MYTCSLTQGKNLFFTFSCSSPQCLKKMNLSDHLDNVKRTREMKLEEARKNGELHECGCCFDDECLFEDMQACADGHIFCKECIRRSCEAAVGQGQTKFQCLTGRAGMGRDSVPEYPSPKYRRLPITIAF